MQVTFKNLLQAYSGKCDGIIYYFNRRLNKVIARREPHTKPHKQNIEFGLISKNLKALKPNEAYIQDLKLYTELLRMADRNKYQNLYSWNNLFYMLMFAMSKSMEVDLKSLTRGEIYLLSLPCMSVKHAVEAGILQLLPGYERFYHLI